MRELYILKKNIEPISKLENPMDESNDKNTTKVTKIDNKKPGSAELFRKIMPVKSKKGKD